MIEIGYLSNDIANSKLKLKTDKQSKKLLSPNNFEFTKNYFFNKIKIIKSQFTQNTRRPSLFFFFQFTHNTNTKSKGAHVNPSNTHRSFYPPPPFFRNFPSPPHTHTTCITLLHIQSIKRSLFHLSLSPPKTA